MATNFIDYIKDVYNSLVKQDEEKKRLEEGKKSIQDEIDEGSKVENKFESSLPELVEYEKLEVPSIDDEELRKNAESLLSGYLNSGSKAIENEIIALKDQYENEKRNAEKSAAEKEIATQKAYETAKEEISNDALKRGLARSSIVVNKQSDLENNKAAAVNNISSTLSDTINSLDNQISELSVKRESALNDFNIAYAAKLTQTINDLKSELEKKQTEAIKYNNSITEKSYDDAVNKAKNESDLYESSLDIKKKENELKEAAATNYESIYNSMSALLRTMSKTAARKAVLDDPFFKSSLNDAYYYKLYDEFCR